MNECDRIRRNYYITMTCLIVLMSFILIFILIVWYFSNMMVEAAENTTESVIGGILEGFFQNIND